MSERNYYQILGIDRAASLPEIRAAYVRLVKRHHPDVIGDLPSRLRDVQQAYRCLAHPESRARHDATIADTERLYWARQRSVQRRLGRYDRRHPHAQPRTARRRWRSLAIATAGILIAVRLSLVYLG